MSAFNGPDIRTDANFVFNQNSGLDMAFQGDYSGGTNLIYKGFARPGTATTDSRWQIAKLAYDGNNNITSITWPNAIAGVPKSTGSGSNDFIFQWSQRTTYTYS
jgi:YD repeat-containing protein